MNKKVLSSIGIVGLFAIISVTLTPSLKNNSILGLRSDNSCNHSGSHIAENAKFGVKEYYV